MIFHWSLGDSKSPQVFRTLLSNLVDLNNAVVWMVFTCPFIFKSSGPFINLLVTVPSITFMFHTFFSSLARSWYLSLFLFPFRGQPKRKSPQFSKFSFLFFFFFFFFLLTIIRSFLFFSFFFFFFFFVDYY